MTITLDLFPQSALSSTGPAQCYVVHDWRLGHDNYLYANEKTILGTIDPLAYPPGDPPGTPCGGCFKRGLLVEECGAKP